ncbi:Alpha/beta hydrolase fold-1 [Fusarium oxysporum]|nr:Alpha/beta hydrolase fold-1 [Fusarium oxysporum]
MSPNPTIVFAPGAWHLASCFDPIREALHSRGWTTEAVEYPSVGAEPPTKGLDDDADAVRTVLQRLADKGEQIVLVVHSYGGLVGANAVKGLGYRQRKEQGLPGGVIMFVYLAAFVTPLGLSIKQMLGGQFLPWMNPKGDYVYADTPEEVFYHDLSGEALDSAMKTLKHQSGRVFTDTVTYEPWHDIETMYFFCDEDKALFPVVQEQMAGMLGPNAVQFHSKASHSVFLSKVDETVKGVELAAEEGRKRAA